MAEEKKVSLLDRFLKASGYSSSDVLASSEQTRLFVTSNGGKYRLAKNGEVVKLQGPDTPKSQATEE